MLTNDNHRLTSWFGTALVAVTFTAGVAHADTTTSAATGERSTLRLRTFRVADVVVQQPSSPQPAVAAPTSTTPVVTEPRKVVQTDTRSHGSYMGTIAWSAIGGAVLGAAVGTAIYYLDKDNDPPARNIAYWAAGGVLLGAGVGVVQVMVEESRTSNALALRAPRDPAPTLRVALYRHQF